VLGRLTRLNRRLGRQLTSDIWPTPHRSLSTTGLVSPIPQVSIIGSWLGRLRRWLSGPSHHTTSLSRNLGKATPGRNRENSYTTLAGRGHSSWRHSLSMPLQKRQLYCHYQLQHLLHPPLSYQQAPLPPSSAK
jgi:hypothetical protein